MQPVCKELPNLSSIQSVFKIAIVMGIVEKKRIFKSYSCRYC